MLRTLLRTTDSRTLLLLRLVLGIVILPHGAQKLLGMFGGHGFAGTMGFMTGSMNIPWLFALLAIVAESFGALGLLVGLFGRVAAFGVAATMTVAAFMAHRGNGFFMNWNGDQKGEGFEYHILAAGIALAIMIGGSGALSLDRLLTRRLAPATDDGATRSTGQRGAEALHAA